MRHELHFFFRVAILGRKFSLSLKKFHEFQLKRSLLEQFFKLNFDIFKLVQGTFIEQEIGRHNIIAGTKFVIRKGEYKLSFCDQKAITCIKTDSNSSSSYIYNLLSPERHSSPSRHLDSARTYRVRPAGSHAAGHTNKSL